jgi:phage terminase large subunit
VTRTGRPKKTAEKRTGQVADLTATLRATLKARTRIKFPAARYRNDPVAFATDILGVELTERQREILQAVAKHKRVAVKSGRRIGKSFLEAVIALWFYCSFPDARVIATAPTARQINDIWWREVSMLHASSGICLSCRKAADPDGELEAPCPHSAVIDGDPRKLAHTGLKSDDFREISGATAATPEAFQGIAGKNVMFLVDEASGVDDSIFVAIEGNRAGGAWLVLFGNPTRTKGEFHAAFHRKKHLYSTFTISSLESPNIVARQELIPGLATLEWLEEHRDEWGEDSALWKIHVLGDFAIAEDGKIFSVERILAAEARWKDPATVAEGRLWIGCDPAGETGSGDETAFAPRRGRKVFTVLRRRGLTAEGHLTELLGLVDTLKMPREVPVVVIDRTGSIGAQLHGVCLAYIAQQRAQPFHLVSVNASDRAIRQPGTYDRIRDELVSNLEAFFREGGAIPEDAKLSSELNSLSWEPQANGRLKVTSKRKLRGELGRSTDSLDAVSLACWEPLALRDEHAPVVRRPEPERRVPRMDPYSALDAFKPRR